MPSAAAHRAGRLTELTNMAEAGKTLEQINHRALQMASPPVAKGYVDEVVRRMQQKYNPN